MMALLAALMVFSPLAHAGDGGDDREKTEKSDSVPTPRKKNGYDKLRKEICRSSAEGGFIRLHRTGKNRIFMEVNRKYSGVRFLAGGVVKATSDPAFVNIGYKYNSPEHFRLDIEDSVVLIRRPVSAAISREAGMEKAMARNYIPETYKRLEIAAWTPDSAAAFFDVTSMINDLLPKASSFKANKGEDKSTYYGEMKAFEDNASITVTQNVDFLVPALFKMIPKGKGTIVSTVSFLRLPERPMRPRPQDARVGVFPTDLKIDLSTAEDGYRRVQFADRWRIAPKDTAAWLRGERVEVVKPIVWYVDDSFPEAWKAPIRKGVLAWNAAFEKIGLKDVMQVRDFPTAEEDPQFDPDNLKYSCLRYIPNATMNAMGPSWTDPTTGEILNATVIVYNDVIRLVNNWRFILTAQVDERARGRKMPPELLEESLVYVISHEIGHTLGLMHNMGASSAYPTDSLRSPSFTAVYGTTPSIMDYARFNYVAQPGDKGVKLVPPSLGVYDEYVIDWLYRPVPQAKDMWEEAEIAGKLLDARAGDPLYRYGAQQIEGRTGCYDPRARSEDLGDDPIRSGDYGVRNLRYILPHLNEWIPDDPDRSHRERLYQQLAVQFNRYIGNVLAQIGGIRLNEVKDGTPGVPVEPVDPKTQEAALEWAVAQIQGSGWLDCPEATDRFRLHVPLSHTIAELTAKKLVSEAPARIVLGNCYSGAEGYALGAYYDRLFALVFHGGRLNAQEKTLQRAIVNFSAPEVAKANERKLAGAEGDGGGGLGVEGGGSGGSGVEDGGSGSSGVEGGFGHGSGFGDVEDGGFGSGFGSGSGFGGSEDGFGCPGGGFGGSGFGEDKPPFQPELRITSIDETAGYKCLLMKKIRKVAKRRSRHGADKAHYQYLYARATAALGK